MRRAERWIRPSVTTQLRRTHRARAAAKIFLQRPRARFPRANACPTRAGLPETTTRQPPRHFPNSPQRVLRLQRREYEREVNLSGISSEPDPKHLWCNCAPEERLMYIKIILACAALVCIAFQSQSQTSPPVRRIVIAASTIFDGKGHVLKNTRIVVEGSKIVAIDPKASPVDYDLRGLTVLPGWIDAHTHITWSFGNHGKNAGPGETTQDAAYRAAANAWATLMAGFTTIQSIGSPHALPLRDAIARGELPGPRILTAVEPLVGRGAQTGTPDEIRAFIRKQKESGADVIKIFAAASIRQGGNLTLSQEQLT